MVRQPGSNYVAARSSDAAQDQELLRRRGAKVVAHVPGAGKHREGSVRSTVVPSGDATRFSGRHRLFRCGAAGSPPEIGAVVTSATRSSRKTACRVSPATSAFAMTSSGRRIERKEGGKSRKPVRKSINPVNPLGDNAPTKRSRKPGGEACRRSASLLVFMKPVHSRIKLWQMVGARHPQPEGMQVFSIGFRTEEKRDS